MNIKELTNEELIQLFKDNGLSMQAIEQYLFKKYNSSCQICGWNQINQYTGKIPLQIHHIDGDCTNNKEENLQLLCPNCHSLTENFGNSNKNSSRIYRKQKGNLEDRYILKEEESPCDTD